MSKDVYAEMLSINGFESAILGTGTRDGEVEVLIYDGRQAAKLFEILNPEVNIPLFLDYLSSIGEERRMPIFVYLDEAVSNDVSRKQRLNVH